MQQFALNVCSAFALLLLFVVTNTPNAFADNWNPEEVSKEISVTADATAWVSPDRARVTVMLETSDKNAVAASQSLEAKQAQLTKALKKVAAIGKVQLRGERFIGPTPNAVHLTANSVVKLQRHLVAEVTSIAEIPVVIDTALKNGAAAVTDIDYLITEEERVRREAILEATARAEKQAREIAAKLNNSLGPVLNVLITETPSGRRLQSRMRQGTSLEQFSEKEINLSVNLRIALQSAS